MPPPSAMACTSPAARVVGRIEGAFLPGRMHGLLIGTLYVRPEGSPGALRARCQETFGDDGVLPRCPPVQQRAPFVRGCAPKDIDPSHETGRVRSAPATGVDDGQSPCDSHRWYPCPPLETYCLQRLVPLCILNAVCLRPVQNQVTSPQPEQKMDICTFNPFGTAACAAASKSCTWPPNRVSGM